MRKWAYLVRFADWSYHEGVLNRCMYCKWVVDTVKGHMNEPDTGTNFTCFTCTKVQILTPQLLQKRLGVYKS